MTKMKLAMPDGMRRMETGAMQFGDDWPGIFMRGDYALMMAAALMEIAEIMAANDKGKIIEIAQLRGLAETMLGCHDGRT